MGDCIGNCHIDKSLFRDYNFQVVYADLDTDESEESEDEGDDDESGKRSRAA